MAITRTCRARRLRTRTCKSHRYPQTAFLFGERDNCPMFDYLGTTGASLIQDLEVSYAQRSRVFQLERMSTDALRAVISL